MNEIERIKEAYERRRLKQKDELRKMSFYFNKGNLYVVQQKERVLLELLRKFSFSELSDKKILDIGCGSGGELENFVKYGAQRENLYGLDLLEDRIERAKYLSPNINFNCGNAEDLPYADGFFDIVLQFTMFTSILDFSMKRRIAEEMLRALKPEGIILWYDYHMDNPANLDAKGVRKKEIYKLFPSCEIYLKRVTLAPPIACFVAPYSYFLCYFLESMKFLNTHYLGIIKKK